MPRPVSQNPTDGELEILRTMWDAGPTSLSTLCEALRTQREVATTTVATMLRVMAEKGLVERRGSGRGALWRARISRKNAARGMVRKLLDGVFEGSAGGLVAHLVDTGGLTADDLATLRVLIEKHPPVERDRAAPS